MSKVNIDAHLSFLISDTAVSNATHKETKTTLQKEKSNKAPGRNHVKYDIKIMVKTTCKHWWVARALRGGQADP